jgi:hypothetical protein
MIIIITFAGKPKKIDLKVDIIIKSTKHQESNKQTKSQMKGQGAEGLELSGP